MDNITKMTNKELEILAELLFDKLMERKEELMIGELARLQTLMMLYENKEEYEKAAVLLKKVNDIKKRLR